MGRPDRATPLRAGGGGTYAGRPSRDMRARNRRRLARRDLKRRCRRLDRQRPSALRGQVREARLSRRRTRSVRVASSGAAGSARAVRHVHALGVWQQYAGVRTEEYHAADGHHGGVHYASRRTLDGGRRKGAALRVAHVLRASAAGLAHPGRTGGHVPRLYRHGREEHNRP